MKNPCVRYWCMAVACLAPFFHASAQNLELSGDSQYSQGNFALAAKAYTKEIETALEATKPILEVKAIDSLWRSYLAEKNYYRFSTQLTSCEQQLLAYTDDTQLRPNQTTSPGIEALYSLSRYYESQYNANGALESFLSAYNALLEQERPDLAAKLLLRLSIQNSLRSNEQFELRLTQLKSQTAHLILPAIIHLDAEESTGLLLQKFETDPSRGYYSNEQRILLETIVEKSVNQPWNIRAKRHLAQLYFRGWRDSDGMKVDFDRATSELETILEKPYLSEPLRRIVEKEHHNITQPFLSLSANQTYLPGSEIVIHANSRNVTDFTLSLVRVDHTRDLPQSVSISSDELTIDPHSFPVVFEKSVTVDPTETRVSHLESIILPADLQPGRYELEAQSSDIVTSHSFSISAVQPTQFNLPEQVVVSIQDIVTENPIAGADVWFCLGNQYRFRPIAHLKTDSQGLARLEGNWKKNELFAFYRYGEESGLSTNSAFSHGFQAAEYRYFFQTDKPAYRPGETVHWSMTARYLDDREYSVPAGEAFNVSIESYDDDIPFSETIELDDLGRYSGSFTLDPEADLGEYEISIEAGPNNTRDIDGAEGYETLFTVDEYRLPEWDVSLSLADDTNAGKLKPGQTIEILAEVNYLSGTPMFGATVDFNIGLNPNYPQFFITTRPANESPQVQKHTATTDKHGRASYRYTIPLFEAPESFLNISATVTTASNRSEFTSIEKKISRLPGTLTLEHNEGYVQSGKPRSISFTALDHDEKGNRQKGHLLIQRIEEWIQLDYADGRQERITAAEWHRRFLANPNFVIDQRIQSTGQRTLVAETFEQPWETDSSGKGSITFTPTLPGKYQLSWNGYGEFIANGFARFTLWAYPGPNDPQEIPWSTTNQLVTNRSKATAGENIEALVILPYPKTPFLEMVWSGSSVDIHRRTPNASFAFISRTASIETTPEITFSVTALALGKTSQAQRSIDVRIPENELRLELSFDKPTYQPKENGTLTLKVRNSRGRPVETDLSLVLTDESIFNLFPDYTPELYEFFYEDTFGGSFSYYSYGRNISTYTRLSKQGNPIDLLNIWGESYSTDPRLFYDAEGNPDEEEVFELSPFSIDADDLQGYRASSTLAGSRLRTELHDIGAAISVVTQDFLNDLSATDRNSLLQYTVSEELGGSFGNFALERIRKRAGNRIFVRNDFRSTLLWEPTLRSNKKGIAKVPFVFGDKIGSWRATARAISADTRIGQTTTATTTTSVLVNRIQAPRFLIESDTVVLSGTVSNTSTQDLLTDVAFTFNGFEKSTPSATATDGSSYPNIDIPSGEERIFFESIRPTAAGSATVELYSGSKSAFDAVSQNIPIHSHLTEIDEYRTHEIDTETSQFSFEILDESLPDSIHLNLKAATNQIPLILDALPYLIDYPYGCTEQTLSRFVPLAITLNTLEFLDIDSEKAMAVINENRASAGFLVPHQASQNPLSEASRLTQSGLERIASLQLDDGTWGWWANDTSNPYLTAYAVYALSIAEEADVDISEIDLSQAIAYLDRILSKREYPNLNDDTWVLHALSYTYPSDIQKRRWLEIAQTLKQNQASLSDNSLALLSLVFSNLDQADKALSIATNLEARASFLDEASSVLLGNYPQNESPPRPLAHWGHRQNYWRWYEGAIETTSFAITALSRIKPDSPALEPAIRWLTNSMEAGRWTNTRDTAFAILALAQVANTAATHDSFDDTLSIRINGQDVGSITMASDNLLVEDASIEIPAELLRPGKNVASIHRLNTEPLFLNHRLSYKTKSKDTHAYGNKLFVRRDFYRIVEDGNESKRVKISEGDAIHTRDRIETVITLETKQDTEFVMIENWRLAGLELENAFSDWYPIDQITEIDAETLVEKPFSEIRPRGSYRSVFRESRDEKSAFFASRLPQGLWQIRYTSRAENAGTFHALPCRAEAMYAPHINARSEQQALTFQPH